MTGQLEIEQRVKLFYEGEIEQPEEKSHHAGEERFRKVSFCPGRQY